MKTSTWIKISMIAMFPMFISSIFMAFIAMEWFFNDTGTFAQLLLTGKFNRPFVLIMFGVGALAVSFIFTTMTVLVKYGDQLDAFEVAISNYYKAEEAYRAATQKLVEKTYKDHVHDVALKIVKANEKKD